MDRDLRQNPLHVPFSLSKKEMEGIIAFSEGCSVQVDFISAIETLKELGFINNQKYIILLEGVGGLSGDPSERMLQFTLGVLKEISLHSYKEFLFIFDIKLARSIVECTRNMLVPITHRERLPNHEERVQLFISAKADIDCGVIGDIKRYLTELAASELNNINNSTDKQLAADRYVVYTCTLVQHYDDFAEKELILRNMIQAVPDDINRTFAEAMYDSRMARLTGDLSHIQRAVYLGQMSDDLLVQAVIVIDIIHTFREKIQHGEETSIEDIVNYCSHGLIGVDGNDFFKRIIYLNLAMYFLKINDRLKAGVRTITDSNRMQAKKLLSFIKNHLFRDIEPRRKLMYSYALAHLHELEGNVVVARAYAQEAYSLVVDYAFFPDEIIRVKDYLESLKLPHPSGFPTSPTLL